MARHLVFVYGTLKRGGSNHAYLHGQRFVSAAHTPPGYRMYLLDGYPGLVSEPADTAAVQGELWAVDDDCLGRLDELEGVAEGLYRREPIRLAAPAVAQVVETYVYARSTAGRPLVGPTWPVA